LTGGWGVFVRGWAAVAAQSWGGPAAQIAVMHRLRVAPHGPVEEGRFRHALAFCHLLPGPEAQQLATVLGWMERGVAGGLVAGGLFIVPGAVAVGVLSAAYAAWGAVPAVRVALGGVEAAILAVVGAAVLRLGRRVLDGRLAWGLGAVALGADAVGVPYPWVVAGAAALGVALAPAAAEVGGATRPPWGRVGATLAVGLGVWWAPLLGLRAALGPGHALVEVGALCSEAAVVTVGGAYAVLGHLARAAVEVHGWLSVEEMVDAVAIAESTPGPLIQIVQFVGFFAGHRSPGPLGPWAGAALGSAVAVWATFVPAFTWALAGAPALDWLRGRPRLAGAMRAVSACGVAAMAGVALRFGAAVLAPAGSPELVRGLITAVAAVAIARGVGLWGVLAIGVAGGAVLATGG
jgi:chromate transporter